MREKCLIISKLCVGLTFYITLCCVVACLFLCESSKNKETIWYRQMIGHNSLSFFCVKAARKKRQADAGEVFDYK